MIDDQIQKARKAFFQFGSVYAFQDISSPVSSCSIMQCCVLSIHLYGAENWIISCESIKKLEYFQGEIAIKENPADGTMVLQSSCLYSTSIRSLCTIRKLRFLHRVKTNEENICHRIYAAMVDDVEALSLVREYRELEGSDFTALIADYLEGTCVLRTAEKCIKQKDQNTNSFTKSPWKLSEKSFGIKPWTTAYPLSRA